MQIINFAQGHGIIYYEVLKANGKNYVVQYLAQHMCSGNVRIYKYIYDFVINYSRTSRTYLIREWHESVDGVKNE